MQRFPRGQRRRAEIDHNELVRVACLQKRDARRADGGSRVSGVAYRDCLGRDASHRHRAEVDTRRRHGDHRPRRGSYGDDKLRRSQVVGVARLVGNH